MLVHSLLDAFGRTTQTTLLLLIKRLGAGLAKAQSDGKYMVFDSTNLSVVHEGREAQEWVRFLAFSPDNKRLAVGHQDNTIVLCDATDGFVKSATITCHQAPVQALDWSTVSALYQFACFFLSFFLGLMGLFFG